MYTVYKSMVICGLYVYYCMKNSFSVSTCVCGWVYVVYLVLEICVMVSCI
jgi:hypothetical protein